MDWLPSVGGEGLDVKKRDDTSLPMDTIRVGKHGNNTGRVLALSTKPECSRKSEPLGAQSRKCRTGPTVIQDSNIDVGFAGRLIPERLHFPCESVIGSASTRHFYFQ